MFVRTKTFKNKDGSLRTYLYIVENFREGNRVRQRILANLGRLERLQQGQLDQLIEGLARYSRRHWVELEPEALCSGWAKELGPVLVFRRLWEQLGLDRILEELASSRRFGMDLEEAVFAMVLGRLCDPSSKLSLMRWKEGVYRRGFEGLELQHFYRSLDFLSEQKGLIEGRLFARVRDLFNLELDLVFWDTTSCYFEGRGGEGLCEYGYSRDRRPDRVQVVIGVLMTRDGFPVAHHVFSGGTADPDTFRVALEDVAGRFRLRRVILVGDRAMASRQVLEEITRRGFGYIVGVRMRRLKASREVLSRAGRYRRVSPGLWVKEVRHEGRRFIVCYNPEEASRDRSRREEVLRVLEERLRLGAGRLVGNRAFRRYLKVRGDAFEIDRRRVKEEARYDGKYVLESNVALSAREVAEAYRGLWRVERAFRELKTGLELRPMYHWTEARIRGHVMVCFLAFLLEVALLRRLEELGVEASLREVLRDLEALKAVQVRVGGSRYVLRTELEGRAYEAFRAVGMRPPPRVLEVNGGNVVERSGDAPLTP